MSEEAKVYLRLGEKALSFDSPISGVSLVPGQVVEVPASTVFTDIHVNDGLKGGHIVRMNSKGEADAFLKNLEVKPAAEALATNQANAENTPDGDKTGNATLTEEQLEKKTKAEILELIEELDLDDDEKEGINEKASKDKLIEFYLDNA